jgi:hypothetical protein
MLRKKLSYEKAASKILVKLTPVACNIKVLRSSLFWVVVSGKEKKYNYDGSRLKRGE